MRLHEFFPHFAAHLGTIEDKKRLLYQLHWMHEKKLNIAKKPWKREILEEAWRFHFRVVSGMDMRILNILEFVEEVLYLHF